MERKFEIGTKKYTFDSKPIVKRLRSQNKEGEKVHLNDSIINYSKYLTNTDGFNPKPNK